MNINIVVAACCSCLFICAVRYAQASYLCFILQCCDRTLICAFNNNNSIIIIIIIIIYYIILLGFIEYMRCELLRRMIPERGVSPSVTRLRCGRAAERIKVQFVVETPVNSGNMRQG